MSDVTGRKKWWKPLLVAAVVAFVGISLTRSAINYVHEYKAEQKAQRWAEEARQAANSTWTEDDAVSWLRQQGFGHIGKGEARFQQVGEPDERYLVVSGSRQVDEGGLFIKPAWVMLDFIFDLDHKFKRVESKVWPMKPYVNGAKP